ncbi:probable polygalacturonase isoform X2 [Durio zibethinus]|uniref:Probable polygalacturonase isoform X2 n=1 Tax=Durio zibethinus TaxID=66656 RepID=A0A6P5ZQW6_DURZI|nr:probable polygalacturonase isoform X2 [Durio zibethinus]
MVETLPVGRFQLQQQRLELKRWVPAFLSSHKTLFTVLWIAAFGSVFLWQRNIVGAGFPIFGKAGPGRPIPKMRPLAFNLTDFGGVGDGVTVNTAAFERAVLAISKHGKRGGAQLNVPPGKWLTAPFNLTSHMTLFLAEDIMWSSDIVISNITLRDSPFWTFHPYDCKNVTVRNVTILAPIFEAPNTDGIDPDSCEDVVIEDCYISVGDDAIAIKSGWDQYGIAYGRPSKNIIIRNLIVRSMVSAGVSIGSEMSGGVSNVTVENILVWSSRRAVRIKTAAGRGGYVKHITYRNLTFDNARVGIVIKTDYNEHPDDDFDRKALPILEDISFTGVHGQGVRVPVRMHGSEDIPVRNVTFRDMSVGITYKKKHIFQCAFVEGRVIGTIFPAPCENLDRYDEEERLVTRSASQNVTDIDYDL